MEINEAKVNALVTHLQAGGGTSKEELAEAIGSTTRTKLTTFQKYLDAAVEKDPNLTGVAVGSYNPYQDETPAEEEELVSVEAVQVDTDPSTVSVDKVFKFFLQKENNTVEEIEQVSQKGTTIIFKKVIPKELVTVLLKGEEHTVCLLDLKRRNPEEITDFGISVSNLILIAEAAK